MTDVTITPAGRLAPEPAPASWLSQAVDTVTGLFRPVAIPLLRFALAAVYVWFGTLKLLGESPVGDMVASMLPFLPAGAAVMAVGAAEIVLGLALAVGVLIPWVCAVMIGHLLGTFLVFLVEPALTYTGNPLFVTLEGEFIAKNLILIAALVVVATRSKARRVGVRRDEAAAAGRD